MAHRLVLSGEVDQHHREIVDRCQSFRVDNHTVRKRFFIRYFTTCEGFEMETGLIKMIYGPIVPFPPLFGGDPCLSFARFAIQVPKRVVSRRTRCCYVEDVCKNCKFIGRFMLIRPSSSLSPSRRRRHGLHKPSRIRCLPESFGCLANQAKERVTLHTTNAHYYHPSAWQVGWVLETVWNSPLGCG